MGLSRSCSCVCVVLFVKLLSSNEFVCIACCLNMVFIMKKSGAQAAGEKQGEKRKGISDNGSSVSKRTQKAPSAASLVLRFFGLCFVRL